MNSIQFFFLIILICLCCDNNESKSLVNLPTGIRSDVVVTSGFDTKAQNHDELSEAAQEEPGWFKRQLLRFGEMTSEVGNRLGGFSSRLASALDKICEVVKTIIPVIAAVCHVGQFKFCGPINEAPQELAEALAPSNLDLNIPD
ncbi:hypothetical protein ILUMI_02190 [Ignelater luminosus]|uniref:Uncharacterized protein n=1 Tax=Ignelater luminosus TaxID=2038154 RepID=A0A8K0GGP9_IGNLU|nr:hypothetical protein ILUMI_02190 [Ignelater luminosus]